MPRRPKRNPWLPPIQEERIASVVHHMAADVRKSISRLPRARALGSGLGLLAMRGILIEQLRGGKLPVAVVVTATVPPPGKKTIVRGEYTPHIPQKMREHLRGMKRYILLHIDATMSPESLLTPAQWYAAGEFRSGTLLERWLYLRLVHEAQHAAEVMPGTPREYDTTSMKGIVDYVNDPHEIRGYARQIAFEAADIMYTEHVEPSEAIFMAPTYGVIHGYLHRKSHNRLVQYVLNDLDESLDW